MSLRLAEYKNGKFERFLEFEDFMISKDYIINLKELNKINNPYSSSNYHYSFFQFNKDEKDPLKRFDGLFDGRTYGDGRFVLIVDDEDDILERKSVIVKPELVVSPRSEWVTYTREKYDSFKHANLALDCAVEDTYKPAGNLHENPEFYEKIG